MEELKSIISDSGQFIPHKNKSIFLNLIDLEKVTIDDIMTPHTSIESISLGQNMDDILEKISNLHYQRILIRNEDNETIKGVLEKQKILKWLIKDSLNDFTHQELINLIDPPYFIPSGTTLYKQIQYFQDNQEKMGLIVNEHGELIGLLSLEDILEEIVGEFNEELPSKMSKIVLSDDGWIVDAAISIRELNKKLKLNLPIDGQKTLNGLILEFFEDIPDPNTSFKLNDVTFEILNAQDRTVKSVKIFKG